VSFVSTEQVRSSAEKAGVDPATVDELVADYADAQLQALKTGLLVAGLLSCLAFLFTARLPARAPPGPAAQAPAEAALAGG
jgi:hypothetical protein